nr:uncharacterized protein LOC128701155 [Cherax quadricarinatus]
MEREPKPEKEPDPPLDEIFSELETMSDFHEAVAKLKVKYSRRDIWSQYLLDVYDPATPLGYNYIYRKSDYYCRLCNTKPIRCIRDTKAHFASREHYDNYLAYLKALEEPQEVIKTDQAENMQEGETEGKEYTDSAGAGMSSMDANAEMLEEELMEDNVYASADSAEKVSSDTSDKGVWYCFY